MIFSYPNLKKFLLEAKRYGVGPLAHFKKSQGIILRHDVDLYLEPAFKMARLEKSIGVTSTFCVMLSSPTYNSLSAKNQKIIRQLADWGFEIALHFDPFAYNVKSPLALQKKLKAEAEILSGICQKKVLSVSLHNPSIYGTFRILKPYLDAYSPAFFQKNRYLSDSCLIFRHDPFEFIKKRTTSLFKFSFIPWPTLKKGTDIKKSSFNFWKISSVMSTKTLDPIKPMYQKSSLI